MGTVIGVDEAGRGPVLGSMFVAAVARPSDRGLPGGVRDSKRIPPTERADLARAIDHDSQLHTAVLEVSVDRIDAQSGRLNHLTADVTVEAIETIRESVSSVSSIVVDACDTDKARYADLVGRELPSDIEVIAEHGADDRFPVVSAASIVAKEAREAHVDELREEYGTLGSGYPSDPTTRTFLAEYVDDHGALPDCARRSWKTCADLLNSAAQGRLTSF